MPNVGPLELIIVLAIALVVFGPKRLPEMGRSLGRGIREFKSSLDGDDDDEKPEITASGIHSGDDAEPVEGEVVAPHNT